MLEDACPGDKGERARVLSGLLQGGGIATSACSASAACLPACAPNVATSSAPRVARQLPAAAGAPLIYSVPGRGDYVVGITSGDGCEPERADQGLYINLAHKVGPWMDGGGVVRPGRAGR